MDSEKITLLVVGALIGFILSIIKDILLENKKKKIKDKEFKRERLEELFKLLSELNENIILPIEFYEKMDSSRISILIRFYFPQFHSEFKNFLMHYQKVQLLKLKEEEYTGTHMNNLMESVRALFTLIVEESKKV